MLTGTNASLALDGRNLDALKLQARQNPEQALKGVAQQFESVFLHQLLKTMREATPESGLIDSEQTRSYLSMLDQQMAQTLSGKGIGLADAMFRQLVRNQAGQAGSQPDAPAKDASEPPKPSARARSLFPVLEPAQAEAGALASGQDFISRMKQHAIDAGQALGIPAKFLLGQAALESGWGKREIKAADGSQSFNLFGIKAGGGWKGRSVDVITTEYVDGVARKVTQKFRAYASYAEAFQDYGQLMLGNKRYAGLLGQTDGTAFAQGLQRAGYATDPNYADKLTRILNSARMRQLA